MRIAICDDSKSELIWVSKEIRNVFERKHIFLEEKQYTSANRMLVENKKQPFDVIFLDLDMKEINGMDVAFEINKLNMATEIVFVTNHDELVYKAYQFKALGFVRKQYLSDEIDEIADLIIAKRHPDNNGIDVKGFANTPSGDYAADYEDQSLLDNFPYKVTILENPVFPVSSTEIRSRIANKKGFRYLVPDAVFSYICENNLYGFTK